MEDISGTNFLNEVNAKHDKVAAWLEKTELAGVLLRRRENVAWMTAGRSSRTVMSASESSIASLLIMEDGRRYYFAANNEAPRLADEDFITLGFEPVTYPWFDARLDARVRAITGNDRIGSDAPDGSYEAAHVAPLRWQLMATEITRYRKLCQGTAAVVSQVLLELRPGISTREIEAQVCYQLRRRGIEPTVLLIACDERIERYKHALTQDTEMQRFGMINLCARQYGLVVSLTRYVHFGDMSKELRNNFAAAALVWTSLIKATESGKTSNACFHAARESYKAQGFAGEECVHHQGGAAGYLEREWLARPNGAELIASPQAFAWNPSVHGAKVEDTILLRDDRIEVMTETPDLPRVTTSDGDITCVSAGVLIR